MLVKLPQMYCMNLSLIQYYLYICIQNSCLCATAPDTSDWLVDTEIFVHIFNLLCSETKK